MQRRFFIIISLFMVAGFFMVEACKTGFSNNSRNRTAIKFTTPKGWPKPIYNLDSNSLTTEGFDLGKKLFYDGRLSRDGNFACGTCHQQFAAFASFEHDLSHGIDDKFTTRNAPTLYNLAWKKEFMWDGGINHLDLQPLAPITAHNEMGETLDNVLKKLKADEGYKSMFKMAFGDTIINTQRMTRALSQFVLMMVSNNSKYDKVMRGEDTFILPEKLGYKIFSQKCASCHAEPFFTDFSYRNTGLPLNPTIKDYGRMLITANSADSLKFQVPSLRNVQLTAPYFHDGRTMYLDQVMDHYRNGVVKGPTTDSIVRNKIPLSNFEIGQIKAFLNTLTDTIFIKDKRFSEPTYTKEKVLGDHH